MTVLNTPMGGGGVLQRGRAGKGMYSPLVHARARQQARVGAKLHGVPLGVRRRGVVGISGVADGDRASDMVAVMAQEFAAVASGAVTEEELARAKAATVSSILMNLESKAIAAEDIGRQILTTARGRRPPSSSRRSTR